MDTELKNEKSGLSKLAPRKIEKVPKRCVEA